MTFILFYGDYLTKDLMTPFVDLQTFKIPAWDLTYPHLTFTFMNKYIKILHYIKKNQTFSDVLTSVSVFSVTCLIEIEFFISAQHYFFIISGIIVMLSIIYVREGNIGYSSDSIKMWRLIMQYNPSTLSVSLC